jgi:hypothetical protein
MNKRSPIMLALVSVLAFGTTALADKTPWFDMEKCEMCKPMMETEGFMENVAWESHPIANGMISIVNVKKGYEDNYKGCSARMDESHKKLMAGEKLSLCGMCQAYTGAMDETVKTETIKTMTGEITLMTSANAETATKLKDIAIRNIKEMAAYTAAEGGQGGGGHEGHNH